MQSAGETLKRTFFSLFEFDEKVVDENTVFLSSAGFDDIQKFPEFPIELSAVGEPQFSVNIIETFDRFHKSRPLEFHGEQNNSEQDEHESCGFDFEVFVSEEQGAGSKTYDAS